MKPRSLSARRLAELLRPRLEAEAPAGGEEAAGSLRPAAVLVPLIDTGGDAELLYIRRTEDLPDHSGQVSFPGGLWESGDADLFDTARREAMEEVGVDPGAVERLGPLAPVTTLAWQSRIPRGRITMGTIRSNTIASS